MVKLCILRTNVEYLFVSITFHQQPFYARLETLVEHALKAPLFETKRIGSLYRTQVYLHFMIDFIRGRFCGVFFKKTVRYPVDFPISLTESIILVYYWKKTLRGFKPPLPVRHLRDSGMVFNCPPHSPAIKINLDAHCLVSRCSSLCDECLSHVQATLYSWYFLCLHAHGFFPQLPSPRFLIIKLSPNPPLPCLSKSFSLRCKPTTTTSLPNGMTECACILFKQIITGVAGRW